MLCSAFVTERMQTGPVEYCYGGEGGRGILKRARAVTRNVELEMVVNGLAWVVEQFAFDREAEYFTAQDYARQHRRGLWATNNPEPHGPLSVGRSDGAKSQKPRANSCEKSQRGIEGVQAPVRETRKLVAKRTVRHRLKARFQIVMKLQSTCFVTVS